jgi:TatD DNase family protein
MRFVDTHCHIDLYPDYEAVIQTTEKAQIYTIAVTNTPSVFRQCAELLKGSRFLRPALGLHPELAVQRRSELALFLDLLPETRYIGEVGLDFVSADPDVRILQKRVFATILDQCAQRDHKVLTIHSRRAAAEVVEMIGTNYPSTCILHWFSGSKTVLQQAIKQGCYFSINASMLASSKGCSIVGSIPRDRVLTETDGPFIQLRGHVTQPGDVQDVVLQLSILWNVTAEEAQKIIYMNFRHILARS